MGKTQSKTKHAPQNLEPRTELIPDASGHGPEFCKSCWFERRGLVKCYDHYLCMNCLTLLLTISERCPICKYPLPTRLQIGKTPTAPIGPDNNPPPYSP
uniref:RING finger protein Z n=1 Tax=Mammarenavirus lunaense TaxID=3052315 RepID=A0A6B7EQD6_9VIRU|nr:Z protein [Mammarenavirus lunaense]